MENQSFDLDTTLHSVIDSVYRAQDQILEIVDPTIEVMMEVSENISNTIEAMYPTVLLVVEQLVEFIERIRGMVENFQHYQHIEQPQIAFVDFYNLSFGPGTFVNDNHSNAPPITIDKSQTTINIYLNTDKSFDWKFWLEIGIALASLILAGIGLLNGM